MRWATFRQVWWQAEGPGVGSLTDRSVRAGLASSRSFAVVVKHMLYSGGPSRVVVHPASGPWNSWGRLL